MVERVGVRELRQNLSRWLERVQAGEAFEVTERGRPVGLLTPLPESGALARLAAQGRLFRPAQVALASLGAPEPAPPEQAISLAEALEQVRADRH